MDVLSGVMKLKDRITPSLKKVGKAVESLGAKITKAEQIINKKSAQSYSKITRNVDRVNSKIDSAIRKSTKRSSINTTRYTKQAVRDMKEMARALDRKTDAINRQAIAMNKLSKQQFNMAKRERQMLAQERRRSKLKQHTIGFSHSIKNLAVGGLPLSYALYASGREYATFEHQMQKVFAKSDPVNMDEQMRKNYIAKAQQLGRTTQFTQTEVAEGMEQLTIAGLQGPDLLRAIDPAVFMAGANVDLGMEGATRFTSTIAKAFSDQIDMTDMKDMNKIADTVSYLASNFKGTASDFEEGLKYTIASARKAGLSWEDTLLNVAALHEVGSVQSMSGTSLNQMLMNLASPTKKGREAMAQLGGISLYDDEGQQRNIWDVFKDFRAKSSEFTPKARNRLFKDIFGIRGSRGAQATVEAIDKMFEKVERTSKGLNAGTLQAGFAERMTKEQLDSIIGQLTLTKSLINDIQTTVFRLIFNDFGNAPALESFKQLVIYGQNFAAIFSKVAEAAEKGFDPLNGAAFAAAEIMRTMNKSDPMIAKIAAAALGFYEGLKLAYDVAKSIVKSFLELIGVGGFDDIRQNVKYLTAALIGFAAITPVILTLGVGLFALTNIVGTVTGAFGMFFNVGKMLFTALSGLPTLGALITSVFSGIGTFFSGLIGVLLHPIVAIKSLGSAIVSFFSSSLIPYILLGVAVLDLFRGEGESFGDAFMNMLNAIGAVFTFIWDNVLVPLGMAIWETIKPAVDELIFQWTMLKEQIRGMFSGDNTAGIMQFAKVLTAVFKFVGKIIGVVLSQIMSTIGSIFSFLRRGFKIWSDIFKGEGSILKRIVQGIFKSLLNVAAFVMSNILSMVEKVVSLVDDDWAAKIANVRRDFGKDIDRIIGFSDKDIQRRDELQRKSKEDSSADEFSRMVSDSVNLLDGKDSLMGMFDGMMGKLDNISENTGKTEKNTRGKKGVNIDGRKADRRQANRQDVIRERAGALKDPISRRLSAEQGYGRA